MLSYAYRTHTCLATYLPAEMRTYVYDIQTDSQKDRPQDRLPLDGRTDGLTDGRQTYKQRHTPDNITVNCITCGMIRYQRFTVSERHSLSRPSFLPSRASLSRRWMGGWMGGWVDGWMDGYFDGWTDVRSCACFRLLTCRVWCNGSLRCSAGMCSIVVFCTIPSMVWFLVWEGIVRCGSACTRERERERERAREMPGRRRRERERERERERGTLAPQNHHRASEANTLIPKGGLLLPCSLQEPSRGIL